MSILAANDVMSAEKHVLAGFVDYIGDLWSWKSEPRTPKARLFVLDDGEGR